MNYFYFVKRQALLLLLFAAVYYVSYSITLWLGWRRAHVFTIDFIIAFAIVFIFFGALLKYRMKDSAW